MKTAVIYKSNTGYTKEYATFISEELQCDLIENTKKLSFNDISDYDMIIYGGSVIAGKINGIDIIKENLNNLDNKKLIIFAVGFSREDDESICDMWKNNFATEELHNISHYYFRGGFDFNGLPFGLKILMKAFKKMLEKDSEKESNKDFIEAFKEPKSFVKKENIDNLIAEVKKGQL